MDKVAVKKENLTAIAQAIREKSSTEEKIRVSQMAEKITDIPTGGNSGEFEGWSADSPPELTISGDMTTIGEITTFLKNYTNGDGITLFVTDKPFGDCVLYELNALIFYTTSNSIIVRKISNTSFGGVAASTTSGATCYLKAGTKVKRFIRYIK